MSLVDQKDGDVVPNGVDPMANPTFQGVKLVVISQGLFAKRTGENFEQVFVDHSERSLSVVQSVSLLF